MQQMMKKRRKKWKNVENETNILALGRLITKHDDGATIGYVDVDAINEVVAFELIDCELALLQVVDSEVDGFDANDDVELDTIAVVAAAVAVVICSPGLH